MGIYDRDYIREEEGKAARIAAAATPVVYILLLVTGLVVFVETFANTRNERSRLYETCSFSVAKFQAGEVWRAATYPIVSDEPMAYLMQLCVLLVFGRPYERRFGKSWLLATYFGGAAAAAIAVWFLTTVGMLGGDPLAVLDGPAPALLALLGASFLAMGRQETTLHLPYPSGFEMRWVAAAFALIAFFSVARSQHPATGRFPAAFGLLAGLAFGAVAPMVCERRRPDSNRPRWSSRRRHDEPVLVKFPAGKAKTAPADDVDDLLEKISSQGMDSLTPAERDRLNAASRSESSRRRDKG